MMTPKLECEWIIGWDPDTHKKFRCTEPVREDGQLRLCDYHDAIQLDAMRYSDEYEVDSDFFDLDDVV